MERSSYIAKLHDAIITNDSSLFKNEANMFLQGRYSIAEFSNISKFLQQSGTALNQFNQPSIKIAVLGDCTTYPIACSLPIIMLCLGFKSSIYEANFNTWQMEIIDPLTGYSRFEPTITLLALSTWSLPTPKIFSSSQDIEYKACQFIDNLAYFWKIARERTSTIFLQHNFALPPEQPRGRLEMRYAWTKRRFVQRVNELLWERDGNEIYVIDIESLASHLGESNWLDPRWYYHSKYFFNPALINHYALALRGTLAACLGKSYKVLVTDLDNTLWGGIVGDLGPTGIIIGPDTPQGQAYLDFCYYLQNLQNRGVLLAINSRNEFFLVEEVFNKNNYLPLRLSDFSSIHCHWDAKSVHLESIARQLNVGLDSLVYIDDDTTHIAEVRENCPEVLAIQLPDDPANYVRELDRLALFDFTALTSEDAIRTTSLQIVSQLQDLQLDDRLESFLAKLHLKACFRPAQEQDFARVEQLFLKTNQFNMTKKNWSQTDLRQSIIDKDMLVGVVDLEDRLVNYGIIAAIVANFIDKKLNILNWVMSCRVFSRTVEQFTLNALLAWAANQGISVVCGLFFSTGRNKYAYDFLERENLLLAPINQAGQAAWQFTAKQLLPTQVISKDAVGDLS